MKREGRKVAIKRRTTPADNLLQKDSLEFQSDLARLANQPPPRYTRAALYGLVLCWLVLFLWSYFAELEIEVPVQGQIIAAENTIVIQPLDRSIVNAIHVAQGDMVDKDDPLVSLDPTFSESDVARLEALVEEYTMQMYRLEAEFHEKPFSRPALKGLPESNGMDRNNFSEVLFFSEEGFALQKRIYANRIAEFNSRVDAYDSKIREVESSLDSLSLQIDNYNKQLEYHKEMVSMRREVFERGADTRLSVLEAETALSNIQARLENAQREFQNAIHSVSQLKDEKKAFRNNWLNVVGQELASVSSQREEYLQELRKMQFRQQLNEIAAPTDAVVISIEKLTAGSVVGEGEPIMQLSPLNEPLLAELFIPPTEIGYVRKDDIVTLKVETLPYQRYGSIVGRIQTVSHDAYKTELPTGEVVVAFKALVGIDEMRLKNLPDDFRLMPGMTLVGDINIGKRSVLSYIFEPLTRFADEAMREPN